MLEVVVARKQREADSIFSFELKRTDGGELPPFTAGSHVDVQVRDGLVRQYSLCNPPGETDRYVIAVLNDPASRGGSLAMTNDIQEGQVIHISEPRNLFPLKEDAPFSVLLAGGVGVTPVIAMAERLHAQGRDFVMHYCGRTASAMAFRDRLAGAPFADRVAIHCDDGAPGQLLDMGVLLSEVPEDAHFYVCGPTGFMEYVLGQAREAGRHEDHLHREYFSAPEDPQHHADDGSFVVRLASSGLEFVIPADKTIAEVLMENGVDVPLSCEQGICGTCMVPVLEGEPEHRDFFMTDAEHAHNDQMTLCCSRAKSKELVIDL